MNVNVATLVMRLVLILTLALGFIFDYKRNVLRDEIERSYKAQIGIYQQIVGSQEATIQSLEKNIEVRKEKMGY